MAGRTHVDSAVAERRLRPIYDWLDNNNNKKALQEAEKVLKKQPNFLCAKVLKGLAYLRLGKEDECQALLDAVRAEEPSDDSTLQAMSICYRELHQPDAVVGVYQAAVRKCPTNEELLTHLFMAYVRVGDLKKQQAQALALYRLRPKNPYYFWAVMSIVMQAEAGDGPGSAISLALAERMVAKLCHEGRIEAEQEVHLYLMILEMQGKTAEALEVLTGPLAEKLVSLVSVPTKRCQLLVQLHRWRDANVLLKSLMLQDINQWALYQSYLDTGFRLVDEVASQPAKADLDTKTVVESATTGDNATDDEKMEADDSWVKMAAFLERLQAENRTRERAERGPALARLEMFRRMQELGLAPEEWLGPALHLLLGFIVKFGDRPCCVSDVRPYLGLVPTNQKPELLALLAENVDLPCSEASDADPDAEATALSSRLDNVVLDEGDANACPDPCKPAPSLPGQLDGRIRPETRGQMLRHVVALQLARCVGARLEGGAASVEGGVVSPDVGVVSAHARRLEDLHAHGATLCPQTTPTEFKCNDGYALLAAHTHIDAWLASGADIHVLRALSALGRAAIESAHNFHVKLLRLRLLHEIGCGLSAHEAYSLLDVKHVQLDSLGHLHCAHFAGTGQVGHARALHNHTLKFFSSNHKDSVEHLTFSYKFGSFGKIAEFCSFRARLHASAQRAASGAAAALLALGCVRDWPSARAELEASRGVARDVTARVPTLSDNRDLGLLVTWSPPHRCVTDNGRAETFATDLDFVRLRCALLACIADAILGSEGEDGVDSTEALRAICDRCQAIAAPVMCAQARLSVPLTSRMSVWPWDATRTLADLSRHAGGTDGSFAAKLREMSAHVDTLCSDIASQAQETNPIGAYRRLMQRCVSLAEVLSLAALLVVSRAERTRSPAPAPRKARRRRDVTTAPGVRCEDAVALAASLSALSTAVSDWPSPARESDVDADAFDPEACTAVRRQISEGHSSAVREVTAWLNGRVKFLDLASSPQPH